MELGGVEDGPEVDYPSQENHPQDDCEDEMEYRHPKSALE